MNGRERIRAILNGSPADRVGFWLGNPADVTTDVYCEQLGIADAGAVAATESSHDVLLLASKSGPRDLRLHLAMGSDFMWCSPDVHGSCWNHPEGKPMFDVRGGRSRESLSQAGVFADCVDVREVKRFEWPNPDYLDFAATLERIEGAAAHNMAIFGGMWMPFFHVVADFFGMENYFIKMYTDPLVVEAVTGKVLEFYLEANRRCLDLMAGKLDAGFFGNDFGSQLDLLVSPAAFKRFVLPYFQRIIDQLKSYGLKAVLHSCGAIAKVIPFLIDAGVDALHPLQAKAVGMDAETLAREFKGKVVFIGGVDTQDLLPFGTPEQIASEVRRLKDVFGEGFVVSPSHEAILPNVSLENAIAMRDAALET